MTTLTEARNRADLFVVVGSDLHALHPRFFERIVNPTVSMINEAPPKRTVVFLGKGLVIDGLIGRCLLVLPVLPASPKFQA